MKPINTEYFKLLTVFVSVLASCGGCTHGLEDLRVEDNPNNTVSCFVSWITAKPSTSQVKFGSGEYTHQIKDNKLVTDHRVLVIGMRAKTEYQLEVSSATQNEMWSEEISYSTRDLPAIVPKASLEVLDVPPEEMGWTLVNVSEQSGGIPPVAVMYDAFGYPVWYYIDGTQGDVRGDIDVRLLENGHVLIGPASQTSPVEIDLAGNTVWEGPEQPSSGSMHHHFNRLPNGNDILLRFAPYDTDSEILGDVVQEISPSYELIWQWNIFNHLVPESDASDDWSHCNSVTVDEESSVFYLCCRNLNAVFKIHQAGSKDIIWQLGAFGDFAPDPNSEEPWFLHPHDPQVQKKREHLTLR